MTSPLAWRRLCESGACVEIAIQGDAVLLRSSKTPEVVVTLTRAEWHEFVGQVKQGRLDA